MSRVLGFQSQSDSLDSYFNAIKGHELLTKKQEGRLARRYLQNDDYDAANRLVGANLRLVVKIAREYYNSSSRFALGDLIQQGNLGLMHAVNKFNPDKQTKFSYYASFWIRAYIFKYLIDNFSSVKIGTTQAQRKLFFSLRKTKAKLRREGLPITPEQIARSLNVKVTDVEQMESRMQQQDRSLNAPSRSRTQEQAIDNLKAQHESAEEAVARQQMSDMLHNIIGRFKLRLSHREVAILEQRIVAHKPLTLQKLGDRFGVSRERIRQIETSIIRKLRAYLQTRIPDFQYYLIE